MILSAMKSLYDLDKLHLVAILDPNLHNLCKMFFLKCPRLLFRLMPCMLMYLVTDLASTDLLINLTRASMNHRH